MKQANILTAKNTLKLDLDGIKLIEASAGTGKTYTISNLYCRYILRGTALNQILLVTFTNAATEELKQRIRLRLKTVLTLFTTQQMQTNDEFLNRLLADFQAAEEAQQHLMRDRLILAIRSFNEAAIHTINGFCQRMLNDYAFYSAQHYELNLLIDDKALWLAAIKDWWRAQSYTLSASHFALFSSILKNLDYVLSKSEKLHSKSTDYSVPKHIKSMKALYQAWDEQHENMAAFKILWQQQYAEIYDYFKQHSIFKKNKLHGAEHVLTNLEKVHENLMSAEQGALCAEFEMLCPSAIERSTYKENKGELSFFEQALFIQAEQIWQNHHEIKQHFKISALLNAQNFALKQVTQVKIQQQSITFNDQLQRLHDALRPPNSHLAEKIQQQFPVALIDEFQDTNALQYAIFSMIYTPQSQLSLILIGDPKQAIYSFRGGDIFTYLKAKHDVGEQCYSLQHNWRSTPALIDAINQLFSVRDDAFIYADAMPFVAVKSGLDKTAPTLKRANKEQAALSLWHLDGQHSTPFSKEIVYQNVANEISQLINEGQAGMAFIGDKPVKPIDIAVLVRNNQEGNLMAQALKQRGIQAINIAKDKVMQSDAAKGLYLVLMGIAESERVQSVRNMLASRLFQYTHVQIRAVLEDEQAWLSWLSHVKKLHELWQSDGFIVMFSTLLRQLNIVQTMAHFDDAERQITNLLHCAELLQQASKTQATPSSLCAWLHQQINQTGGQNEAQELRLESEAELVKIVTVHKSKGLEYPIVFVPFLWNCSVVSQSDEFYHYHNEQHQAVVDYVFDGKEAQKNAFIHADKERLAEDMRLLYVALTRARTKCYCVTGQAKSSKSAHSALAFLLHPAQTAQALSTERADIKKYAKKNSLEDDIKKIAQGSIDFKRLDDQQTLVPCTLNEQTRSHLKRAQFSGEVHFDWQISSFSRMTRDIHQVAHGGQTQSTSDDIFNFKRGGQAGTFLHHILELLDFSGDVALQTQTLFKRFAPRYALDDKHNETVVAHWMREIVNTALNAQGFKLADLSPAQRLDELAFDFSLQTVDIKALNQFLINRSQCETSLLTVANFKGMMTGFIDLVFEHEGKYYIADYKSNFLGTQLSDYTPTKLKQAVIDRRYDLQYLLYSLALHRYLTYRLPNYCYEQHFGGVYYLFLRAMREKTGEQFGVFFDCPSQNEMNELDQHLFKTAEVSA